MKIISLKGGLGNQLFEYCRYRQLIDKKENHIYLFYDFQQLKQHNKILLSDCFDVTLPKCSIFIQLTTYLIKLLRYFKIAKFLYDDENYTNCLFIDDYNQNKQYISSARSYLKFKKFNLSSDSKEILNLIRQEQYPISIHVRRGDYLNQANINNFGICPKEYYQASINICFQKHPEAKFFLFSDDMDWVKKNLTIKNAIYVLHSDKDYIDMYLMSQCKGHIIANSTFSFWAAILSPHSGINIYPKQWFINPNWIKPDIFPEDWICL